MYTIKNERKTLSIIYNNIKNKINMSDMSDLLSRCRCISDPASTGSEITECTRFYNERLMDVDFTRTINLKQLPPLKFYSCDSFVPAGNVIIMTDDFYPQLTVYTVKYSDLRECYVKPKERSSEMSTKSSDSCHKLVIYEVLSAFKQCMVECGRNVLCIVCNLTILNEGKEQLMFVGYVKDRPIIEEYKPYEDL